MPSALSPRHFAPLLTLSLVAGVAYVHALALARVLAPALLPSPRGMVEALARPSVSPALVTSPAGGHETSADRLLERNPFDSQRGSLLSAGRSPADDRALAAPPANPYAAPPCERTTVLATAASPDARRSFALLARTGARPAGAGAAGVVRRQGDDYEGKRVWLVSWDRVWLRGPASFCQAALFAPAPGVAQAGAETGSAPGAGRTSLLVEPVAPGVFRIERSLITDLLGRQADLAGAARLVPELGADGTRRLRLQSLRPGSPLARLGLEEGDRLESLNGLDVSDQAAMLEAYARLQRVDRLRISLTRRGRPTTLDYDVR